MRAKGERRKVKGERDKGVRVLGIGYWTFAFRLSPSWWQARSVTLTGIVCHRGNNAQPFEFMHHSGGIGKNDPGIALSLRIVLVSQQQRGGAEGGQRSQQGFLMDQFTGKHVGCLLIGDTAGMIEIG